MRYRLQNLLTALFCIGVLIGVVYVHPMIATERAMAVQRLQNAATTGNGSAIGIGTQSQCRESAIYIEWSALTTAGAVVVETARDSAYTGTWASLTTVTWSAASKTDVVQVTGVLGAVRTRISSTVTGGTVSTYALCN